MATKISEAYKQAAIEGMSLNITEDEMFVLIPSERGNNAYRLWMDEQTMQPKSCNCAGFCRWQHCKHCTVIAECFAGYVAPTTTPVVESAATPVEEETPVVEQEPRITEIEAGRWFIINKNTQVWRDDESGKWFAIGPTENALEIVMSHLEKQSAVKAAEEIVSRPPVQEAHTIETIPLHRMLEAPLTSNRGFRLVS